MVILVPQILDLLMSKQLESSTCNFCLKIALDDTIFCEICMTWLHPKCLKMSLRSLKAHGNSKIPYYCPKCVSNCVPFTTITNFQFFPILTQPQLKPN